MSDPESVHSANKEQSPLGRDENSEGIASNERGEQGKKEMQAERPVFCPDCRKQVSNNVETCPDCGTPLINPPSGGMVSREEDRSLFKLVFLVFSALVTLLSLLFGFAAIIDGILMNMGPRVERLTAGALLILFALCVGGFTLSNY